MGLCVPYPTLCTLPLRGRFQPKSIRAIGMARCLLPTRSGRATERTLGSNVQGIAVLVITTAMIMQFVCRCALCNPNPHDRATQSVRGSARAWMQALLGQADQQPGLPLLRIDLAAVSRQPVLQ